jgi:hypothetical protein
MTRAAIQTLAKLSAPIAWKNTRVQITNGVETITRSPRGRRTCGVAGRAVREAADCNGESETFERLTRGARLRGVGRDTVRRRRLECYALND